MRRDGGHRCQELLNGTKRVRLAAHRLSLAPITLPQTKCIYSDLPNPSLQAAWHRAYMLALKREASLAAIRDGRAAARMSYNGLRWIGGWHLGEGVFLKLYRTGQETLPRQQTRASGLHDAGG